MVAAARSTASLFHPSQSGLKKSIQRTLGIAGKVRRYWDAMMKYLYNSENG
jgi:hypothetical protein